MTTRRVLVLLLAFVFLSPAAPAQTAHGRLTVNGASKNLTHAVAYEVDSPTDPGYMDVIVLLSDRKLPRESALRTEILEGLMLNDKLAALRVVIDPDGKIKSAAPYHPSFKSFIQSGAFVKWKPTAYDVKTIAGRVFTDGQQQFAGQRWSYDLTFSAPITLDPAARTVPDQKKSQKKRR